ncbi:hypothetical protein MLD38_006825 [Melastoma candidum]|uniref:Uncharacterized protein n=1 Tax=Melastoma candidum TaxID=119954 RepID=A0ACB9RTB5_9MYRT|nr:hypothetical protein MLD38_006825 [Melastoma candidum]
MCYESEYQVIQKEFKRIPRSRCASVAEDERVKPGMDRLLLHGMLHGTIYEVVGASDGMRGSAFLHKITRKVQCNGCRRDSKLYVTVDVEKIRVFRSRQVRSDGCHPRWNESFHFYCAHEASQITFSVKQVEPIGVAVVGTASMAVSELMNGEVDTWLEISRGEHQCLLPNSRIHFKIRFDRADQEPGWSHGIEGAGFAGVPYTLFPQRKNCRVTLYQDAHVANDFDPGVRLADGKSYEPQRCWEDIFDAISNAKHFVYIAGWSVYTKITLVRDFERWKAGGNLILGELLKKKASEGVRVLMLVWDDKTSDVLKKHGIMATHDEDTKSYFHNSKVCCVLCPRNPDNGQSIVKEIEIATMFSHHQKIVIVDHAASNDKLTKRRVVSFIGGIDLCDGRYDTQSHPLFRTLDTTHLHDLHQPNFPSSSVKKGGPREPWHDVHCRLEGPIARDVLVNFEQRWRKQGGDEEALLSLRGELKDAFLSSSEDLFPDDDPESWNVQLFRSIDGGAAIGIPRTPKEVANFGLIRGKEYMIERSIHDGYINAIRRAKSFIYIENQYFQGSSFSWTSNGPKENEVGATNLIPKELSLKIVSKIENGERFMVYVVIPMWPEGVPESDSVQTILHWQTKTMEMMYKDIARAIWAKGIDAEPTDYLAFFCLGNREMRKKGEYIPPEQPKHDSDYGRAQYHRRFMIYVHAKTMIVDDEYIIVGSANINQRSMDGARDTEIAMGAYQPCQLCKKHPPKGKIHGFRRSLWYEHMRENHGCFDQPDSLECMETVRKIAEQNWEQYCSKKVKGDLPGQLMRYPVEVARDGVVRAVPGIEHFPDTKAKVLGSRSHLLPELLTT